MVTPKIIDTNVPKTTVNTDITTACRLACVTFIGQVLAGEVQIVVDTGFAVIGEYLKQISPDRRNSADLASRFLIYLFDFKSDPQYVRYIPLQKDEDGNYELFPKDPELANFDREDRKWVALAIGFAQEEGLSAPVVNATDSDWLHFEEVLQNNGIQIDFLCKNLLKPKRTSHGEE